MLLCFYQSFGDGGDQFERLYAAHKQHLAVQQRHWQRPMFLGEMRQQWRVFGLNGGIIHIAVAHNHA